MCHTRQEVMLCNMNSQMGKWVWRMDGVIGINHPIERPLLWGGKQRGGGGGGGVAVHRAIFPYTLLLHMTRPIVPSIYVGRRGNKCTVYVSGDSGATASYEITNCLHASVCVCVCVCVCT